jgi:hypothetical protein
MKNKIKKLEKYILLNESNELKFDFDKIQYSCRKYDQPILNLKEYFEESDT